MNTFTSINKTVQTWRSVDHRWSISLLFSVVLVFAIAYLTALHTARAVRLKHIADSGWPASRDEALMRFDTARAGRSGPPLVWRSLSGSNGERARRSVVLGSPAAPASLEVDENPGRGIDVLTLAAPRGGVDLYLAPFLAAVMPKADID